MNIMLIGHNSHLMVDTHNHLSKCFKVQSYEFDWNGIVEHLATQAVDLIFVCLKDAKVNEMKGLNIIREHEVWKNIKFAVIGFNYEINNLKEFLQERDKVFTYPVKEQELLTETCNLCGVRPPEAGFSDFGEKYAQKHVLVVDDDARMLRAVKSWLDGVFQVSVVSSGEAALSFLEKQRPDVVLLDYEMPNISGAQTLERIRKKEAIKDLPVVFLTGVSDREKIKKVVHLNPKGYILKGVTREEMIMKLNELFLSLEQEGV